MKVFMYCLLITSTLLISLSAAYNYFPTQYNQADNELARQIAGEAMVKIADINQTVEELECKECEIFLMDAAEEFNELKHIAEHYKGDLAKDVVYAYQLAEYWCYSFAEAVEFNNPEQKKLTKQLLDKTIKEFKKIQVKNYEKLNGLI